MAERDAAVDVADGRRVRGDRSRRAVARRAVDVASLEGLEALSIGRLAGDLGMSKSGVQTLFGTKERLQLAAVDLAREMFVDAVVRPVSDTPGGLARLRALVERWLGYARAPLFAGGCFFAANMAGFDSRSGPVRDALLDAQRSWRGRLAEQLRLAVAAGELESRLDPDLVAFQLDAVLGAANTALRLGDPHAERYVRQVVDGLPRPPG